MNILVEPGSLKGNINAISSKSDIHRSLIAAFLSKNCTELNLNILSEDIIATANCIKEAGFDVSVNSNRITVDPKGIDINREYTFDCNESGSTVRFLVPVISALGLNATFIGKGRLPERPLSPMMEELQKQGIIAERQGSNYLPLKIRGKLKPGEFKLQGNISSQFVTGLLFALPLLDTDSKITLIPPVESRPYIDMTLTTLKSFGITVKEAKEDNNTVFIVPGNQEYISPGVINAEGDWSNAAFWFAAGALSNSDINISGLSEHSYQGDKYIAQYIQKIGADIYTASEGYNIKKNSLNAIDVDAASIPDLVPIIAVCASVLNGTTRIYNAGRLRIKESDRLHAISFNLINLGADITELNDGLIIRGKKKLEGGVTDSFNDHRIAMAMTISSNICNKPVIIKNAEAVNKSYPTFYDDFRKLGGVFNVIDIRE